MSITFDLNVWSSLTTVWGMSSALVQRTLVPTATVSVFGDIVKLPRITSLTVVVPAAGHGEQTSWGRIPR